MLTGAIIGGGKIAVTGHMPAYHDRKLKSKIKISAVVDPTDERRKSFTDQFPGVRAYDSVDDMFLNEQVDFVDICTPPKDRVEIVRKAVNNKVHILNEKPFALTLSDAHTLMTTLNTNDCVFMPCHQYKYSPIWMNFKKAAEAASPESKIILRFSVNRLEADAGFTPALSQWRTDPVYSGGGILADTGIHYIYLSYWMLGSPLRVSANIFNLKHKDYGVEDTAIVVLESEKGIAEMNLTWAADRRANHASLVTANESLSYDGKHLIKYKKNSAKNINVPDAADKSTYISYYISLIDDFRKMILNKSDCTLLKKEAFESIHVLKACYKSASLRRTIELPIKD